MEQSHCYHKIQWDCALKNVYQALIKENSFICSMNDIIDYLEHSSLSNEDINAGITCFTTLWNSVTDPLLGKDFRVKPNPPNQHRSIPNWANADFFAARADFYRDTYRYNKSPTKENRENLVESREIIKSASKTCKNNYRNQETLKLMRARESNAKAYWNLLKGNKTRSKSTLTLTDFKRYFEKLSNPNDPFY